MSGNKTLRVLFFTFKGFLEILLSPFLLLAFLLVRKKRKSLVWCPVPIINNKYWSRALKESGHHSITLMESYYSNINKKSDYDRYYSDFSFLFKNIILRKLLGSLVAFLYTVRIASVIHIPFSGGPLGDTVLKRLEGQLYKLAGIKVIVIPYGADIYMYSRIPDPVIRHGLLLSYPEAAKNEKNIARNVEYWTKYADVILMGFTIEGVPRWDIPVGNLLCIDTRVWFGKINYNNNDGKNGTVKILHIPNHRGVKATEFLIYYVEKLKRNGLKIELVLFENMQNSEMPDLMQSVDILADQFLLPGYGMTAIEGMASGLPVLSNLSDENYTKIFRRYSFLNECPIVSTTPESLEKNLEILVTNPELRKSLGQACRIYTEKYHSYRMAQYLFGSIYSNLLDNRQIDLANLFHPLLSEYNNNDDIVIKHPLINNKIPDSYFT